MIVTRFNIPIYKYDVIFVKLVDFGVNTGSVKQLLEEVGALEEDIQDVLDNINDQRFNGSEHFYNFKKRKGLILIYKQETIDDEISTIAHEKRHLEDRLLDFCGIKDIEAAGYLAGYLAQMLR